MTDSSSFQTNRDLFSNHYLTDTLRDREPWNEVSDEEVREAYEEISDLVDSKLDRVEDYNEAQLERNLLRPIFDILDIPFEIEETVERNARRPDYGFFPSDEAADAAFDREDFYEESIAVADAKRWGRKLDTRGEEKRDFENPSYQIHRYLQETPTQWGVLTNGAQWRLYYEPTSHRLDSYYEIDLPAILDTVAEEEGIESFKYFYLFFRQGAFLPDETGDCFLDDVYNKSNVFAEELGEDLQENIYDAIRVLAEGFIETNEGLDEGKLDLIHDSSLIYLYRLIFVLYAESEGRDLLPTNNDIYSSSYSLNQLKLEVVKNRDETQQHYQTWQTDLWDQLDELFVLIDKGSKGKGIPKDDLYIPAYNGGLFRTSPDEDDTDESQFLSNHEVGDAYIAEVIELLTRHEASEGDGKVFVDYSSLDERNLGSIYEGLLEYKIDVASEPLTVDDGEYISASKEDDVTVEEGDVYLRTDDGERKATGSYYTPEYIVEYILDETLKPLVDGIREDMLARSAHGNDQGFAEEFADRVFDLTVLDPAMGSGHFLVNAVDYLAREIIDAQEQQDRQALQSEEVEVSSPTTNQGELRDINWARRKVAQRCIYGVDVNPLATELAKVSLWLRTLAAEQPLAFLDHHLKTGNSMVGSDIEKVLANGNDDDMKDGQLTLQESFDHTRKRAMEHITDRFQDLLNIDNETLEDAKEMEAVYDDVRADPLYKKLLAMANVHTANEFGLDVPTDADERMARALQNESWDEIKEQDWFKNAQAMAGNERFFHWELEFPMAFYNQSGERKSDAGFNAVIGNPPYVESERMVEETPTLREYISDDFETTRGNWDLYIPFVELSVKLSNNNSSMIIPNKWLSIGYGEELRKMISSKLTSLSDFSNSNVFEGVGIFPIVYTSEVNTSQDEINIVSFDDEYSIRHHNSVSKELLEDLPHMGALLSPHVDMTKKLLIQNTPLHRSADCEEPFTVSEAYELKELVTESSRVDSDALKLVTTGAIDRYSILWGEESIRYLGDDYTKPVVPATDFKREFERRYQQTTTEKILVSGIRNFEAAIDENKEHISSKSTVIVENFSESLPLHIAGAILNSNLMWFYIKNVYSPLAMDEGINFTAPMVRELPFPDANIIENGKEIEYSNDIVKIPTRIVGIVESHTQKMKELLQNRREFNLDLLDYLGDYTEGVELPDIGFFQPSNSNILDATTEDYEKLQIERAQTKKEGGTVTIEATARYKPDDDDDFETDAYGYTETEFFEAFSLTDLSKKEATMVKAFVPVAVNEEIGGFRDNATKNNSLMDRLKEITLPDPDEVADDLRRYTETKERANELDEKIEKIDQQIDQIVYNLYGLTDEEIEFVEGAVAGD